LDTPDSDSFNPYAAPLAEPETFDPFQQDDTRVRQQFIDCEANVRSIGELMLVGGGILATGSTILLAAGSSSLRAAFLLVIILVGAGQCLVGLRVRRFLPRARIGAIIFCGLWLFFIPIGTIFGGACLWYLVRPAATFVFTPEYQAVIRRTPHVRFRTSAGSWAILALVLLGVLGLVVLSTM
jgi:hypothetical protein